MTLSVAATAPAQGDGFSISYQWQLNGADIPGANGNTLIIHGNTTTAGVYSVRVSNAAGSTNASWQVAVLWSNGLLIGQQPSDQYQIAGGNVSFGVSALSSNVLTYQWQFESANIVGATNAWLQLTDVQAAQQGSYHVIVSDSVSILPSSNAAFTLVTVPTIISNTLPKNIVVILQSNLTLSVAAAAPGQTNGFPLHYQWQFSGTNIPGQTSSSYTFSAANPGSYSVIVTNAAGATNASWQVNVLYPGSVWAWGTDAYGESDYPTDLTNAISVSAGSYHSVAVLEGGMVRQWGRHWADVPADLTNALAASAGYYHTLALRTDGTLASWGSTNFGDYANFVPTNLNGATAIAAGWKHNLALLTNHTVVAWGETNPVAGWLLTAVPPDLTNVTAIAADGFHSLALRADGTVAAWGSNYSGETNVPTGLSNVVSIAAGAGHCLALRGDGTVVAWGLNDSGQCDVPPGLSNVMAAAAGDLHSVALKNDGSVVAWGDNTYGQANVPPGLNNVAVKLIAAGGNHTLAAVFSPLVRYSVDVTKDLLLIYNTNSTDSVFVKDYYLTHRPMVGGANVLGISCTNRETFFPEQYTNLLETPVQNWLGVNPTKRPQYVVLFLDVPSRVNTNGTYAQNDPVNGFLPVKPSVQYRLHTWTAANWLPFVSHINMNGTNDCIAYIDKLAAFATNRSQSGVRISARSGAYADTNYYFDDVRGRGFVGLAAMEGVIAYGAASAEVDYDPLTNSVHILSATNVSGYFTWGYNGGQGACTTPTCCLAGAAPGI